MVTITELPTRPRDVRPRRRIGMRQRLGRWDVKVSPYLYISPFFVLFAITGLFPLLYTAVVSLHKWNLLTGEGPFVGLKNYVDVLHQPFFWKALRNTFSIFALSTIPQIIIALVIAAVLNANLRARTFWRMGVLVPYVVAPVAVAMIFGQIFSDQSGMMNAILSKVGISPVGWHSNVLASHLAIANMVNYRWTGYNTLVILAAMQAIPNLIFVIITSTIGGLQIFDEPTMFDQQNSATTAGGADGQFVTVTMYLYQLGWGSQNNLGRSAAVAWLLFLVILAISLVNYWFTNRIASDSGAVRRARKVRS
ncbi:MAG: ABC transporter permease [Cellulomonas sp. 73-145]|uniref:carbohydrate ABC transporter permease n=1 Tax=Cellulomonas sp. 73-145 TaxID=1895739 RepID=UPI00092C9C07|nr:sugar ABC transporter permease [Cellulomonas sp. 73-145]OJV59775.1 MAG: ABC transporter permease [Cellulomonas sp. 73-145]